MGGALELAPDGIELPSHGPAQEVPVVGEGLIDLQGEAPVFLVEDSQLPTLVVAETDDPARPRVYIYINKVYVFCLILQQGTTKTFGASTGSWSHRWQRCNLAEGMRIDGAAGPVIC